MVSVSSRVMPMKPTFWPSTLKILYGLNGVGRLWPALFFQNTFAPRYGKSAPLKVWPAGQESWPLAPSPSARQPPFCMRSSSLTPSSNSWLPTEDTSRPIRFMAVMVGSSWKAAESSGLAPMRSPAATVSGVAPAARDFLRSFLSEAGQVGRAARLGARDIGDAGDVAAVARGRLEVAVEVVEGQQVELDVVGLLGLSEAVVGLGAAGCRRCAPGERRSLHPGRVPGRPRRPRRPGRRGVDEGCACWILRRRNDEVD